MKLYRKHKVAGWITIKEAAKLLNCSVQCVYNYIKSGKIVSERINCARLIDEDSVNNFRELYQ